MKIFSLFLFFLNLLINLYAQDLTDSLSHRINSLNYDSTLIIDYFGEIPEIIGGFTAIQSKIIYPKEALKNNIQGRVIVKGTNSSNGDVLKVEVVKGIGYGCDEEAKRVVMESKWEPYCVDDSCSNYIVFVPIHFKLEEK